MVPMVSAFVCVNGELVCKIDMDSPFEAFAGYYGNEAGTNKKILHDVFQKVSVAHEKQDPGE